MQNQKLIAVLGPTASGKTALAVELALRFNGEIISGDSMLVFKNFNIGTAKPTSTEMRGVKHHLIDICEPVDNYNVAQFQAHAKNIISDLNYNQKIPILCGGTGLYAKALLEGYDFSANGLTSALRDRLNALLANQGIEVLRSELLNLNSNADKYIDLNNPRRIIRAIETILSTGELPSQLKNGLCYNAVVLAIECPREQLYYRINRRVDQMVANGLFEEVSNLLKQDLNPGSQALQGIGYKELVEYFSGKCSKTEAVEKIKINTRHFAKRQLTWYKKMPYIQWITATNFDDSETLYTTAANLIADKFNLQISTRSGNESYSG